MAHATKKINTGKTTPTAVSACLPMETRVSKSKETSEMVISLHKPPALDPLSCPPDGQGKGGRGSPLRRSNTRRRDTQRFDSTLAL